MNHPRHESSESSPSSNKTTASRFSGFGKIGWFILGLLVLGVFYSQNKESLNLQTLVDQELQIRQYYQAHVISTLVTAFLLYTLATGVSFPGAALMTLLYAWFFGFWTTMILVSFASTAGATLNFLLSRYLLRDFVQRRLGHRLLSVNKTLEREGAFYLFSLRLIPAVPFFVINPIMGLTPMRIWTFWWVSQIGMLPGTCVYVFAGTTLPGPTEILQQGASGILNWKIIAAFILLALFPWVVKKMITPSRND